MIRRLLMAVLFACLAIPAVAVPACHASPLPVAATLHHGGHSGHDQTAPAAPWEKAQLTHGCIGCVAPFADVTPMGQPPLIAPLPIPLWIAYALPSRHDGPETPPPRSA